MHSKGEMDPSRSLEAGKRVVGVSTGCSTFAHPLHLPFVPCISAFTFSLLVFLFLPLEER